MTDLDWRTVRELMALRERFRKLIETAMLPETSAVPATDRAANVPVDVWESDADVVVEAELPGAASGDVSLRLEGNTLVLSGELTAHPQENGRFVRIERYRGRFRRTISLPAEVTSAPEATLRSGVLRVRLPKKLPARRRIVVEREAP